MRNGNVRYKNIWNEKFTGLAKQLSKHYRRKDHELTNIAIGTTQSKAKKKDGGGEKEGQKSNGLWVTKNLT